MLFLFQQPARTPFWMWGMLFPIDLIWVSRGRVVGWEENLVPLKSKFHLLFPYFLKRYRPLEPVDAVLEVKAGFCKREGMDKSVEMAIELVDQ